MIGLGAAVEHVGSGASGQVVVAGTAAEHVVRGTADEVIAALASEQQCRPATGEDLIVARTAVERSRDQDVRVDVNLIAAVAGHDQHRRHAGERYGHLSWSKEWALDFDRRALALDIDHILEVGTDDAQETARRET